MILSEKPDLIIQCVDANHLKQSLMLTADLSELGIPMVISLNAIDETSRRGIWIDSGELSRILGIPVVESMALHGRGTEYLRKVISTAKKSKELIRYIGFVEEGVSAIESKLPEDFNYKRKASLLLLLDDPFFSDYINGILAQSRRLGSV